MQLKDPSLLRNQAYINGVWVDGPHRFPVVNPADGRELAQVPDLGSAETKQAIAAASAAWGAWKARPAKDRSKILRAWNDLILANADDLATILTAEQGKPLAEAKGEITYGASFVEWFAEEAKRIYGDILPTTGPDRRMLVLKEPIGVVELPQCHDYPQMRPRHGRGVPGGGQARGRHSVKRPGSGRAGRTGGYPCRSVQCGYRPPRCPSGR